MCAHVLVLLFLFGNAKFLFKMPLSTVVFKQPKARSCEGNAPLAQIKTGRGGVVRAPEVLVCIGLPGLISGTKGLL